MGVGTMIVFISMVLVSGLAAGVLIKVANDLQQQAQATATETMLRVSTGLTITEVWGDRGTDVNETITYLWFKIQLQPGSPDISMDDLMIGITDYDNVQDLSFLADTNNMTNWDNRNTTKSTYLRNMAGISTYTAEELRDPQDTFYNSSNSGNNMVITYGVMLRVFVNASAAGIVLEPQDTVRVNLMTSGYEKYEEFTLPEAFTGRLLALN